MQVQCLVVHTYTHVHTHIHTHTHTRTHTYTHTHTHTYTHTHTVLMKQARCCMSIARETVCALGPHFSGALSPAQPSSLSLHGVCAHPPASRFGLQSPRWTHGKVDENEPGGGQALAVHWRNQGPRRPLPLP